VCIQILDGTGTRIIADSQGTTAQQQAYQQLNSKTGGLNLTAGKYVVKVTYGAGGNKTQPQNYAIQLDSGTTFQADYRTLADPETVNQALQSGGSLGFNTLSSTAAELATNESNLLLGGSGTAAPTSTDIFGVLSVFPTDIFA
jgi:hypothetical protein